MPAANSLAAVEDCIAQPNAKRSHHGDHVLTSRLVCRSEASYALQQGSFSGGCRPNLHEILVSAVMHLRPATLADQDQAQWAHDLHRARDISTRILRHRHQDDAAPAPLAVKVKTRLIPSAVDQIRRECPADIGLELPGSATRLSGCLSACLLDPSGRQLNGSMKRGDGAISCPSTPGC